MASQDPSGVVIWKLAIEHAPYPHRDLLTMKGAGIPVHVVREDIEERGIPPDSLVKEFDFVSVRELPALFARYDQVWHR
jgi:hypothetical protein